jgi:predicted Zn-dependent peptidase
VNRLTFDDLKRYHQQMMQTSRLLLVVVGDIDRRCCNRSGGLPGKLPRGTPTRRPSRRLPRRRPSVTSRDRRPTTCRVYAAPPLTSNDIYAACWRSILRERTFTEVRVRRSLSYAPDAFLSSQGANTGGIYFTAVDANQTAQVMLGEITRLQTEPTSPDEIKAVAQQFLTTYYMGQETNAAQTGELAEYELLGGGWRNAGNVLERLRGITPEEVGGLQNYSATCSSSCWATPEH